ncbi:3-keto-disaccharide hydrolase [Planctomycetaceae bacterium SH139]
MLRYQSFVFAALFSLTVVAQEADQKAPPEPAGMQSLFDGETLAGWDGDPRLWSVKDGVIHGQTTEENKANGNTFLIWQGGELNDFELRLSFRCTATNNSGIQYRSRHITEGKPRNAWVVRGYQHEIRNEETLPNVSGFIYDEGGKRGRICLVGERAVWTTEGKQVKGNLISKAEYKELFNVDQWNDVIIIAKGNRLRHYMNGRLVLDFTDEHPELALSSGVLALQLHAGKPMWAEFKDIRMK